MSKPTNIVQATVVRTADALARRHTDDAIQVLVDAMHGADKDADRIKAAAEILDRGHGKPLSASIQLPVTRRLAAQLEALGDAELEKIATAPIARAQLEAQDAEFQEVPRAPNQPRDHSQSAEPATPPSAAFDFDAALDSLPSIYDGAPGASEDDLLA